MSMMLRNWAELPEELLNIIAEKLKFYEDFLRFSVVCHPWRSVTLNHKRHTQFLKSFPWLMLTADEDEDYRSFFIPSENRVCSLYLPEARGCHCWGSPYGWLVTLSIDQQIHLLNPLSRARLSLPPLPLSILKDPNFTDTMPGTTRMRCIIKAIVSPDTNADNDDGIKQFLIHIIIGTLRELVLARPGDTTWTVVEHSIHQLDVINFSGKIYSSQHGGYFQVCDSDPRDHVHHKLIDFAEKPNDVEGSAQFYLVELGGELHLVARTFDISQPEFPPKEFHHFYKTVYFEVFKFDFSTRKWDEELKTLGDYALFLGSNTSFALKASDYPECKPGCIYFTDDCDYLAWDSLLGGDMGIYNLETDTFETLYDGDNIFSRFSPPVWIAPSLI